MDEESFIAGAETMRKAVFHALSPLLQSLDYGGHSIASIFKDVGLLYDITADNINDIRERADHQFLLQEIERLNVSSK